MSESNWGKWVIVGLVALNAFLAGGLYVRDTRQPSEQANNAQNGNQTANKITGHPILPIYPSFKPPISQSSASEYTQAKDHRDLQAQEWMAWSSFWMLVVTSAGVYFVARTLKATERALNQTSAATKAAEDAVKITEKFAYFQTRPFLNHHGVSLTVMDARKYGENEAVLMIDLKLKNTGKTPANTKFGRAYVAVSPRGIEEADASDYVVASFFTPRLQVAAEFDGIFPIRMTADWNVISSALEEDGVIWIRGSIPYSPIFAADQTHAMDFSYFVIARGFKAGVEFDTTAGKNEAT